MIIFDVIRHEHHVIRTCLARIAELGERKPQTRQRHFLKLCDLLQAHAAALEAIVHVPLLEHDATAGLARRGRVRHDVVASLARVLAGLAPTDPDWTAYFAVLAEVLELQMQREEKELFRVARKVLDATTQAEMGDAMLQEGKGREVMAQGEIQPAAGQGGRSLH